MTCGHQARPGWGQPAGPGSAAGPAIAAVVIAVLLGAGALRSRGSAGAAAAAAATAAPTQIASGQPLIPATGEPTLSKHATIGPDVS